MGKKHKILSLYLDLSPSLDQFIYVYEEEEEAKGQWDIPEQRRSMSLLRKQIYAFLEGNQVSPLRRLQAQYMGSRLGW